jgi:hypothetical protein
LSPLHNRSLFNGRADAAPRWNHKDRSARRVRCAVMPSQQDIIPYAFLPAHIYRIRPLFQYSGRCWKNSECRRRW